jgi:hypothetical protein
MAADLLHITAVAEGARPVFRDRRVVLATARRLSLYFGARTLWFCVVDSHVHDIVEGTEAESGRIRRDVAAMLAAVTGKPFDLVRAKPIVEQSHLLNCWPYVVDNAQRHGVRQPVQEGSGLADVLGARRLPGFDRGCWQRHLPRVTVADLLAKLELPAGVAYPARAEDLRGRGAVLIAMAAAAVAGVPDLSGRSAQVVAARAAAVEVCGLAGVGTPETAHALGVSRQAVWRLGSRGSDGAEAILQRIGFDAALSRAGRNG